MDVKRFATVRVKAVGEPDGLAEGQFEGYASVFGNVDSYGDIVQPGAFRDTLATDWPDGKAFPLLWGHDTYDPFSNLGSATGVEDDHGLKVTGTFDLDNPKAAQVYRMVKGGRVDQMSFAYDVIDAGQETQDGQTVNLLKALKLYEVSIVPYGANAETEILAVKSNAAALAAGVKSGRVLAARHLTSLQEAVKAVQGVIDAASDGDDDEKAAGQGQAHERADGNAPVPAAAIPVNPSAWEKSQNRILNLLEGD